jgi:hypothetical protein
VLRFVAVVLAIIFLSLTHEPASPAAGPLVTGKCWCAIWPGAFIAKCGSQRVTCTKPMCAKACQAMVPKK